MIKQFDWPELSTKVAELCSRTNASAGAAFMASELAKLTPGLAFREVLVRGGWYRLGGVINPSGEYVARDLEQWAESELAAVDDDMEALCDAHIGQGLMATKLCGRTHYFVAANGPGAGDFIQLEIEELQEAISHPMFDDDDLPSNIEELVDPRADGATNAPRDAHQGKHLGAPFLVMRRLTPMFEFLERVRAQRPDPQSIHRFLAAWEQSSAGAATQFSNHWVIAVREHLDRYQQNIVNASPVAALNGAPPKFAAAFGMQGLALHDALARYDKLIGYPMAWFFHMLTTRSAPHALANAVIDDVQAGFQYLPDRDAAVVKDWLYKPYGF